MDVLSTTSNDEYYTAFISLSSFCISRGGEVDWGTTVICTYCRLSCGISRNRIYGHYIHTTSNYVSVLWLYYFSQSCPLETVWLWTSVMFLVFTKGGGGRREEEEGHISLGPTRKGVHREHSYISITSNMTSMTVTYTQHRTPTIPCSLSLTV